MENNVQSNESQVLGKTDLRNQRTFEPGEEKLNTNRPFKSKDGRARVGVWIDGGSTQTRGIMMTDEEARSGKMMEVFKETYVIPSTSHTVSTRAIPSQNSESDLLYDNMYAMTSSFNTEATIDFKQVTIRGGMAELVSGEENRVGSKLKTHDPVFYSNLVDWLGYTSMLKFGDEIPTDIDIHMAVALPPDDLTKFNLNVFYKNMKSFVWKSVPHDITIKFNIIEIMEKTEPEAYIKAYYILSGQDVPEIVLHTDGGGRSSGTELLVSGVSSPQARPTHEIGGTHLLNDLNDAYVDEYGGRPLPRKKLEEAIRTGYVSLGEKTRNDVVDLIKIAKDQKASELLSSIRRKLFDSHSKYSQDEVSVVSVSGRLFEEGDYGYSIAEKFMELALIEMPNAEFIHIKQPYIPQGLFLLTFQKMSLLSDVSANEAAASEESPYTPSAEPETEVQEPADAVLVETEAEQMKGE